MSELDDSDFLPDWFFNKKENDELREEFTCREVDTAEDILRCLKGAPTAYNFRRLLLLLLRGHYSSSDNYLGFDHLNCYVWHPDDKEKTLNVHMTHEDDDANPDSYPGVYVGFSELTLGRLGIRNNFAGNNQDRSETFISKEATVVFDITHVAKRAQDAWDLAELSSIFLQAIGPAMAEKAGATGFEVQRITSPKEKKPSPEKYYSVAITVEIRYTQSVSRSLESHRVRQLLIKITTKR